MIEDPRDLASDDELAEAADPDVGDGTPETAPHREPPTTLLERQPVRVAGAAQAIVTAAAVILAFGAPVWAALALAVALYGFDEWKRRQVTPTAAPRLDEDTPLRP